MGDDAARRDTRSRPRTPEVLREPAFALFWSATTLRGFGGAVSGVAVQVLIVSVLEATPSQIGVLSAVGVLPYLFLGLIVGALMDRWRRQRTLIITTIGRAVVLAAIPVLLALHALGFWTLALVLLVQGVLTLFAQSAEQPLLPRLVPKRSLVAANARLGQSDTVVGTVGPALAGALITAVGAPILFVLDAIVTAIAAGLQSRIAVREAPSPRPGRHLGREILVGVRYTYGHGTLRPLALSVHLWFLGNSIVSTLFGVLALRELGLAAWAFGVAVAFGGIGGLLGALVAPSIGWRLGAGRAILLGRALAVLPWAALAALPVDDRSGLWVLLPLVAGVQLVSGLSMGIEDANDTGYRQSIAPDELQGRMNSTIRTVNRTVFFVGALLTGVLVTSTGYRVTVAIGAVAFAAATVVVLLSPLRRARHGDR